MQPSLVQRLRDSVTQCRALDRSQLLTEAADEIERLREAVHRYLAEHDTGDTPVTEPMPVFVSGSGSVTPVSYSETYEKRVNWPAILDTTRPQNGTPADGSVQGEGTDPVAWGLPNADGDEILATSLNKEAIERHCPTNQTLVPLYRHPQPTLTDLERASIMRAIKTLKGAEYIEAFSTENDATAAATMRGLLERLK